MVGKSQSRPASATGVAASGAGAAGAAASAFQQPMGNAAMQDLVAARTLAPPGPGGGLQGSIDDNMPDALKAESVGVGFTLGGGQMLQESWKADVSTDGPTRVNITVTRAGILITFGNGLHIDAMWPASNMRFYSVFWDFKTGKVGRVDVRTTQSFAYDATGTTGTEIGSALAAKIGVTPFGRRGYDPFADPELATWLQQLKATLSQSSGTKAPGWGDEQAAGQQVSDLSVSAGVSLKEDMEFSQPGEKGGMFVAKGTTLDIEAFLEGGPADLEGGSIPGIKELRITSSGLVLRNLKKNQDMASIEALRVLPGGIVKVDEWEPLGKLKENMELESGIRGLIKLGQLLNGRPPQTIDPDISPDILSALADSEMEAGLTRGVQRMIEKQHAAIPGVDLRDILGMKPGAGQ